MCEKCRVVVCGFNPEIVKEYMKTGYRSLWWYISDETYEEYNLKPEDKVSGRILAIYSGKDGKKTHEPHAHFKWQASKESGLAILLPPEVISRYELTEFHFLELIVDEVAGEKVWPDEDDKIFKWWPADKMKLLYTMDYVGPSEVEYPVKEVTYPVAIEPVFPKDIEKEVQRKAEIEPWVKAEKEAKRKAEKEAWTRAERKAEAEALAWDEEEIKRLRYGTPKDLAISEVETDTDEAEALQEAEREKAIEEHVDDARYVNFTFTDVTEEWKPRELHICEGFRSESTYKLTVSITFNPDQRFDGLGKPPEIERPESAGETIDLYVALFINQEWPIHIKNGPLAVLRWPDRGPSTENAEFLLKVDPLYMKTTSTLDVYIYFRTNLLYIAHFEINIQPEDYLWSQNERPIYWRHREDVSKNRSRLFHRFAHINQMSERGLNLAIQSDQQPNTYLLTAFMGRAELPARITMTRDELNDNLVKMRTILDDLRKKSIFIEGGYTSDGVYTGDYSSFASGYSKFRDSVKTWDRRGRVFKEFMEKMAVLGSQLWDKLFTSESAQLLLKAIEEHLQKDDIIQIWIDEDAGDFVYPWVWLYGKTIERRKKHKVQNDLFWGYQYIIEQLPQFPIMKKSPIESNKIASDQLNIKIGTFTFEGTTDAQKEYFKAVKEKNIDRVEYKVWESDKHWEEFLPKCDSQILYFFSHGHTAKPVNLSDRHFYDMKAKWEEWLKQPGPEESKAMKEYRERGLRALKELEGTDLLSETHIRLRFGDLLLRELQKGMSLRNSMPLVFLNMCESAQVFPNISGGLIDVFLKKGARGVIGTEIPMMPQFADLFSKKLFDGLFYLEVEDGHPECIGKILLDLRREFLEVGNPLGFAYTLFGDATTHLSKLLTKSDNT